MDRSAARGISPLLLTGFAVASAGGPLALATLYLVSSAGVPPAALVRATIVGIVLFGAPLFIWLHYGRHSVSDGGLTAFARAAAGERFAWLQGVIWSVSYLLYLPYTVTYIVFYLLPAFTRLPARDAAALQLALPVALTAIVAAGRRVWLWLLLASAAIQLAAVAALGAVALAHGSARAAAAAPAGPALPLAGGAQVASLFVCISLVLYLGGSAAGGGPAMRRALLVAYGAVAAATLFAAAVLAVVARPGLAAAALPGVTLARLDGSPGAAVLVGLLTLLSVGGLIVSEYVALTRLWQDLFGFEVRSSVLAIGVWFLATDAVGLIHPHRFYNVSLIPSLAALFLSQAMVFAVYPAFAKRVAGGRVRVAHVALAVVALAWTLFGLYSALAPS